MTSIAVAALVGWQVGDITLTSVVVGAVALQPTTAIALIVGAVGLVAGAGGYRWISGAAGTALLVACVIWLSAYASPHAVPTDLMLFRAQVLAQRPAPLWPGRSSIITCVVIALFAASLLGVGVGSSRLKLLAMGAASLGALIASLSILPFLLQDASQLSILHQSLRIALNTSVAVGALCAGVLILKRDVGWVRLVAGGGEQGRIARLLIPIALIPVAFGTVTNIGVRAGLYGPDVRMLLIIVLSAVALLFLAFWAAQMLGRERAARDSLADALQRSTVMIVDGHGKLRHWPAACEALYGWTAAEVLGRRPGEFLNVEGAAVREKTRAAIREHGEWRGEIQHWTKSGDTRWVALQWVLQRTGDGEERVVGTISDITDLKLAEASLRESQERLTLAIGAYDLGICDIDIATETIVADEGLERMFGVAPGAMNGSVDQMRGTILGKDVENARSLAAATITAQRPSLIDDLQIHRPDGEVRDLHGVRRFFYSEAGAHVRTICIYRDVTEERRAQAELALRGDRLAELRSELTHVARLSAMGEMAAALAHELNQPLTAIGNSVGALKIMLSDGGRTLDDTARARIVRAANQAEGQAVRAGEIVRRLRDFIARGEADARIEQLEELIVDAVALAAPNARSDGTEVRFEFSPKAGRVLADRIQIQQILVNLIRNANEAMRERPAPHVLVISTCAKRGMVEVSVRDNGPGVAPDFATRLFSPFSSTKNDGMGVGLSICRRIVEAHGGLMWLEEPSSGGGADFRFTIPLATKELQHA
ncbi:PAS domain-containing sensor histidine kinase [Phenylobacterium sp.]|uniref:PAS domain-containing sensor histidine kinase n=1 Tax=Phenylobacterium sp. TaxID=1871053 RepID=UPI002E350894|nr:ATP-binding protein [Phenylobacterium sp.]HEX3365517.1 ATP-binding protein [Phenylobacterium sp.]